MLPPPLFLLIITVEVALATMEVEFHSLTDSTVTYGAPPQGKHCFR